MAFTASLTFCASQFSVMLRVKMCAEMPTDIFDYTYNLPLVVQKYTTAENGIEMVSPRCQTSHVRKHTQVKTLPLD